MMPTNQPPEPNESSSLNFFEMGNDELANEWARLADVGDDLNTSRHNILLETKEALDRAVNNANERANKLLKDSKVENANKDNFHSFLYDITKPK